jgi:hypothetical protein
MPQPESLRPKVGDMPKRQLRTITLDDPDGLRLYGVWSRSGAHLGLSIWKEAPMRDHQEIELRPEQVEELIEFLTETLAEPPADRHQGA